VPAPARAPKHPGEIVYDMAAHFAEVSRILTDDQKTQLVSLRKDSFGREEQDSYNLFIKRTLERVKWTDSSRPASCQRKMAKPASSAAPFRRLLELNGQLNGVTAVQTTILVVDDKASVRTVLRDYLTEDGCRVVAAKNGRDALYVARHEKPDLILLDIMMPEMGGYEFLRASRKERNTPVILLTARLEESDKVLGLELGADDYVTKPFGMRELIQCG
jgi:CheY-like chemotaxis protein